MKAVVDGDAIVITKNSFVNLQESQAVFVAVYPGDGDIGPICEGLNLMFAEDAATILAEEKQVNMNLCAMIEKMERSKG